MLLMLFWTFFKVGLVSFGGGYAILSVIEHEVIGNGWMSPDSFADAVSLAGMSPGPIATNSAVLIGFQTAGLAGAIVSILGIILPSFLIIIALALFFYRKSQGGGIMQAVLYGLKPMVAAMVVFAAYRVGVNGQPSLGLNAHSLAVAIIFVIAVVGIVKYKLHPLVILSVSALMGVAFFY